MRFSHFSVFALSGLAIASPVLNKRADVGTLLTDLYATVQIYTGAINATLAPLSASSDLITKTAASAQVGAQINLITAAILSTTGEISKLPPTTIPTTKRSTDIEVAHPEEKRQIVLITIAATLSLIIIEVLATVGAAIAVLGLGLLTVFTTPLPSALAGLIVVVQLTLNVALLGVITLLNTLLTGLALGVSGL